MSDQELYQQAIDELNSDRRRPDLWARAVAIATDDHDEARDLYTNLRVEELIAERGPTTMPADAEPDFAALSLALAEGDEQPAEDLTEKREEVETAFASLDSIDLSNESDVSSLEDLTSSLEAGPTLTDDTDLAATADQLQTNNALDTLTQDPLAQDTFTQDTLAQNGLTVGAQATDSDALDRVSLSDLSLEDDSGPVLSLDSGSSESGLLSAEPDAERPLSFDDAGFDDSIEITEIAPEESALDSLANELQSNIGDTYTPETTGEDFLDTVQATDYIDTPAETPLSDATTDQLTPSGAVADDNDLTLKTDSMEAVFNEAELAAKAAKDAETDSLQLQPVAETDSMPRGSTVDYTPDEERVVFTTSDMLVTEHDQTQSRTQSFDATSSFDNDYTVDLSGSHDSDGEPVINNPEIDLDGRANQTSANDPVRTSAADDQFILNPESNPRGTAYALLTNDNGEARAIKSGVSWPAMFVTLPWLLIKGLWGTALAYLAMLLVFVAVFVALAISVNDSQSGFDLTAQIAFGIFGLLAVIGLFYLPFKYGNQWLLEKAYRKGFNQKASVLAKSTNDALGRFIR